MVSAFVTFALLTFAWLTFPLLAFALLTCLSLPVQAAIDSMTRSLALEWGYYGIRVVAVAPGWTADTTGALLRQVLLLVSGHTLCVWRLCHVMSNAKALRTADHWHVCISCQGMSDCVIGSCRL